MHHFENQARKIITAVAFSAMGISTHSHAFAPLSTDDTGTQGRSKSQIELGFEYAHDTNLDLESDDRIDLNSYSSVLPLTYTYGITDNVDASIGIAGQLNSPSGFQNPELGIKWNFFGDPASGWSAAIKPTIALPVSKSAQGKGLGTARANWGMNLIGSYVAEDYEFHANLKYNSNYQSNIADWEFERNHIWTASVSPVWVINDHWKMGFEIGVQTNPSFVSANEAFTQLAVSYAPIENLQIGVGIGAAKALGAESKDRGFSIATNIAYQF